jgi:hypothetical protein
MVCVAMNAIKASANSLFIFVSSHISNPDN